MEMGQASRIKFWCNETSCGQIKTHCFNLMVSNSARVLNYQRGPSAGQRAHRGAIIYYSVRSSLLYKFSFVLGAN